MSGLRPRSATIGLLAGEACPALAVVAARRVPTAGDELAPLPDVEDGGER